MKCPHCAGTISPLKARPAFPCPHCSKPLETNFEIAGILTFVASVLLALPFGHGCTYFSENSDLCYIALIAATGFVSYWAVYRPLLRIRAKA